MARRRDKPNAPPDQRWTPASDASPSPQASDTTDRVVDALPIAEANGHKVGRQVNQLFCWHCDAIGSVLEYGPKGSIFTERCKL